MKTNIIINSISEAEKYTFKICINEKETKNNLFFNDKSKPVYLQEVKTKEIYLKGNLTWIKSKIIKYHLNVENNES